MNEYDKNLERMIKYTIAYMIAKRKDEVNDEDMGIAWKMISKTMCSETEDKV